MSEPEESTPSTAPRMAGDQATSMKQVGKWVLVAAVVALLAVPIIQRMRRPAAANPGLTSTLSGADAQIQLSLELYQAGKYQDSVDAAKVALRLKPDAVLAYNNIAVAYLQLKKYDEALTNIKEALRLQPDLALAKTNLAWILREQAAANGTAPTPTNGPAEALIDESLQKYQAGDYRQCIDLAEKALKIKPDMPEAYNNISAAYIKLEMWDKAIDSAQAALRGRPDFELAKGNLNWALFKKNGSKTK